MTALRITWLLVTWPVRTLVGTVLWLLAMAWLAACEIPFIGGRR